MSSSSWFDNLVEHQVGESLEDQLIREEEGVDSYWDDMLASTVERMATPVAEEVQAPTVIGTCVLSQQFSF